MSLHHVCGLVPLLCLGPDPLTSIWDETNKEQFLFPSSLSLLSALFAQQRCCSPLPFLSGCSVSVCQRFHHRAWHRCLLLLHEKWKWNLSWRPVTSPDWPQIRATWLQRGRLGGASLPRGAAENSRTGFSYLRKTPGDFRHCGTFQQFLCYFGIRVTFPVFTSLSLFCSHNHNIRQVD